MTVSSQEKGDHASSLSTVITPIHKAGYPFIAAAAVITLVLMLLWAPLGVVGALATAWVVYFFRDPERTIPEDSNLVISPADGRVQTITRVPPPPELTRPEEDAATAETASAEDGKLTRISIFLNVFDVHVNRVPVSGKVEDVVYTPGKFVNAALDKASVDNERSSFRILMANGQRIVVSQIAGLVARRIICNVQQGQDVRAGGRFGLIRFGSRVDVYLPPNAVPRVAPGQRAIGGETVLAELASDRPALRARRE